MKNNCTSEKSQQSHPAGGCFAAPTHRLAKNNQSPCQA